MAYQPFHDGSVVAFQSNPSSLIVGASIIGQPIFSAAIVSRNSSVITILTNSSVAALQGTNPWIISNPSVTAYMGGAWSASVAGTVNIVWPLASIAGTYAEDAAHTTTDRGLFTLAVRNDTMSSVTSADLEYSQHAVGPVGENLVANAPINKWIQADTSIMANVSVQAIAAQGASIFTYVTAVQVVNVSPNNVYITFTGGLGGKSSVLGYSAAPANGGSNITLTNAWKTGANMGVSASVSGMGSIFLSMQGFVAKI